METGKSMKQEIRGRGVRSCSRLFAASHLRLGRERMETAASSPERLMHGLDPVRSNSILKLLLAPFSEPFGWLSTTNSTRVSEPILSWNQFQALTECDPADAFE
jgi:hypothetical protein